MSFGVGFVRLEGEKHYDTEPSVGFLDRLWLGILSLLPIEWLL